MSTIVALLAALYFTVPTTEKERAQDLSFLVTFDRHCVRADFAKGSPDNFTLKDLDLGLRGCIGFDVQSAFKADPGESLHFPAKGNFDPHRGTLVFWTQGENYDPCDARTDGKARGNVMYATLVARGGANGETVKYYLYECDDEIFFDWTGTPNPWDFNQHGRTHAVRKGIRRGEWHQIAATWDDEFLSLYLNGEPVDRTKLPVKVENYRGLMPDDSPQSYIGVRPEDLGDRHEWAAPIDDFAIYSRALSPIEIRNQYLKLLKDRGTREMLAFDMTLNGVVTGPDDKCDRLEAEFDFAALGPDSARDYGQGKLTADYELSGPKGERQSGKWTFKKDERTKMLSGVVASGEWKLAVKLGKDRVVKTIVKPDMPWLGNGIGNEDEVPDVWKDDFRLDGRKVSVWNRRYEFGHGPLPERVFAYGREILEKRPRLLVNGEEPQWEPNAAPAFANRREVKIRGRGKIAGGEVVFVTTVAFDGMVDFSWEIVGEPAVDRMDLVWRVGKENRQFLMTPTLCEDAKDPQAFKFPKANSHPKELWLVSEKKGGFAFMAINDANWVYDSEEPVYYADRSTGRCQVRMITKPVAKMPAATPYRALFIATPTRPQPQQVRGIRYADWGSRGKLFVHDSGAGWLNGVFTHAPGPEKMFEKYYSSFRRDNSVVVYGGMKSLTDAEPESAYFQKFWGRPGATTYTMPYSAIDKDGKEVRETRLGRPCCASTVYADYYVWCDWKLWTHPLGRKFWQSYSDLCGVGICRNPHHGCQFRDRFGRTVSSFDVLHTRNLIIRLVALAHRYGKTVLVHGQRDFVPFAQGISDYWLPGEQYTGLLRRNKFGYTDEIPDAIWRSEFNRDVIGVGIIMDVALGQTLRPYTPPPVWKYTWGMIAAIAPHDIEISHWWCAPRVMTKYMDIQDRYSLYDNATVCHRFYEQDEVTSSAPELKLTWYDCAGGGKLLVVSNCSADDVEAEIDVSKLGVGDAESYDEINETKVAVRGGKLKLTVPSRALSMLGLPCRQPAGGRTDADVVPVPAGQSAVLKYDPTAWSHWKREDSAATFERSKSSPSGKGALSVKGGAGSWLMRMPVTPGREYTGTVWVRTKGTVKDGSRIVMSFQSQDAKCEFLHLDDPETMLAANEAREWRKMILTFTVPDGGKWKGCAHFLVTIGMDTGPSGELLVDDFSWQER